MREIQLDLAEVKYKPPKPVRDAVKSSASEINRYPSGDYLELKTEASNYFGVQKNQVCFSNGLDEMIDLITGIYGGRNFIPIPTFSQFARASDRRGQKTIKVQMIEDGNYKLDLDRIDLDSDIIWLCSPNNPTGTEIPRSKIVQICESASGKIVLDECYAEFADTSQIDLVDNYSNLIVLRSFSKSFCLAGLRLGTAVSQPENIDKIEQYRQPFNVNQLSAKAGKAALRNIESYEKIWEKVISTGRDFSRFLEEQGFSTGEVNGNFLLVEFEDEQEARQYFRGLQKLNVSVFPGWDNEFSGLGNNFLRFSIGRREQMDEVQNRFKILEQKLQQED